MGSILVKVLLNDFKNKLFFDKKLKPDLSDKRNIYLPTNINNIDDEYVYIYSQNKIKDKNIKT